MSEMPKKKHHSQRSAQEREELTSVLRKGSASAQRQRPARILLRADTGGSAAGSSDSQIAASTHTSIATVERVRRICLEHGLERALERKDPERDDERKLDGKGEAPLIALCCGPTPQGRARWTLRLLAGRLVELEVVESICHETVRQVLKKTNSSRGAKSSG